MTRTAEPLPKGLDQARVDRAARASKVFKSMLPTLSSYARALTRRDDLRVVMAAGDPHTDGNEIRLRPPIALGDLNPHDRSLCEKRDQYGTLLCPACAAREDILIVMYHEVAHIAYDSFASTTEADKQNVLTEAIKRQGSKYAQARFDRASWDQKNSYIGIAHLVHEYLPVIVNALEDCRVNREMYKARPGTEIMFTGLANRTFLRGIELEGGTFRWDEQPIESQLLVGLFARGAGYDYRAWFAPQAVAVLDDTRLGEILDGLRTARSVRATFELAFPVLNRLQELGYFPDPDMPQPDPEPEPEQDDEPQPDGESEDKTDTPGDQADDEQEEQDDAPDSPEQSDEEALGDANPDGGPEQSESDDGGDSGDAESGGTDSPERDDRDAAEGESDGRDASDGLDEDADVEPVGSDADAGEDEGEADPSDEPGDGGDGEQPAGQSDDSEPTGGDAQEADDAPGSDGEPSEQDADGGVGDDDSSSDAGGDDDDEHEGGDGSGGGSSASPGPESGESEDDSLTDEGDPSDPAGITGTGDVGPDATGTGAPLGDRQDPAQQGGDRQDPADPSDPLDGRTAPLEEVHGDTAPKEPELPEGSPDAAQAALDHFGQHDDKPKSIEEALDEAEMDRTIIQGGWFEQPSANVTTVRIHEYDKHIFVNGKDISQAWQGGWWGQSTDPQKTPEQILGAGMQRMRVTFDENKAARHQRNLKAGRVNARVLGRRVAAEDDRLFHKKILPGKKDYFVVIGVDISGSTVNGALDIEKAAVEAQAELLTRTGVPFVVYCHTAMYHSEGGYRRFEEKPTLDLDMYLIKDANEPWNDKVRKRLWDMQSSHENLDGHTLEFYRKLCDKSTATDKIILYYTDGKMPAANAREELAILQREIKNCKQRGITLLGVGVNTDSPKDHGLDTVQIDTLEDTPKVVRHLEKRMSER